MPASDKTRASDLLFYFVALAIALFFATRGWDQVFWQGAAHPVSNDSFYHLARMLEIARDPGSIHEFDSRLHWPDGTWIVWPWAYDYLVGFTLGLLTRDTSAATAAAMFTPLMLLAVNLALFAAVARSVLLPRMLGLGLLAYAAAPLTRTLHKLGQLDHHAAEHSWWLAVVLLTIRWHCQPASATRAAALGVALGLASGFHNGLFILQLPVLGVLLLGRVRGGRLPLPRAARSFCIALLAAQLAVLLPSHHFWSLNYGFFHLSWFHLHVASLTCVGVLALSQPSSVRMWAWLAAGALLALPAFNQAQHGLAFMGAQLPGLGNILEANSPYWGALSAGQVTRHYSAIVWLLPAFAAWAAWRLFRSDWRTAQPAVLLFALFGALLLAAQIRFQQYGLMALVVLPLLAFQEHFNRPRDVLYAALLLAGAYLQSPGLFSYGSQPGGSARYARAYELILVLESACAQRPGPLLADRNWGNFLRYRTGCPIIANNFVMTPEDFDALDRTLRLLAMRPEALRAEFPDTGYLLVSNMERHAIADWLLTERAFEGYEMLGEVRDRRGRPIARAFRVSPAGTTPVPAERPGG